MNQQNKKQVIILGAFGVVLVGVLFYQFVLAGGDSAQKAPTGRGAKKTEEKETPAMLREVEIDPVAMLEKVTHRPPKYVRGRNPMEPMPLTPIEALSGAQVVSTEEVRDKIKNVREKTISAIIYDGVRPLAVIDDEIVELGYVYPDGVVKVHAIEPTRVIFEVEQMLVPVDMKEL